MQLFTGFDSVDQGIFRHLKNNKRGRYPIIGQQFANIVTKGGVFQVLRRQVDGDVQAAAGPQVIAVILGHAAHHPAGDFVDHPRLFGGLNKHRWRQGGIVRAPTNQRFNAYPRPCLDIDDGLVTHAQLIVLERLTQLGHDRKIPRPAPLEQTIEP
ncbi:hypothetical protein D3C84_637450 [compost metagenome]